MKYKLDAEEKLILKDVENGIYKPVENMDKEIKRYQEIAGNTTNKTKNINLRVREMDLEKLKFKANESGIPYQTIISSLIHRFANGQIDVKL